MKIHTLKEEILFEGIGLHKGEKNKVILRPKKEIGIRIFLKENGKEIEIPFDLNNVETKYRCIAFKKDDKIIFTFEHLLSSLLGFGNIQCDIIVEGNEVPCFDTSSYYFVSEIKKVGLEEILDITPLKIKNPINFSFEDEKEIIFLPSSDFKVTYIFKREKGIEGFLSILINPYNYEKEISKAKTFIFFEEIEKVREMGLGKGGNEKNVIVYKDGEIINKEILSYHDEFIRHKILDLIGDFSLLNYPFNFHIIAIGTGHRHHIEAIKKLRKYLIKEEIDIKEIIKILPHRYPFLLVDKILNIEENRIVGIKNVTFNENFFQGHFPENPIMPGVLIVEALAQTGGILIGKKLKERKLFYFAGIEGFKFRKQVLPGDTILMEVEIKRWGGKVCKMYGRAYINDEIAAEGELIAISEG